MNRRQYLASIPLASAALAGCSALTDGPDPSRLDLTVQNDTDARVTADVTVTGPDGETYLEETDGFDPGVARAFDVTVATEGRHEAVVASDDVAGSVAWDAGVCSLYDGRVRFTPDTVESEGECVESEGES